MRCAHAHLRERSAPGAGLAYDRRPPTAMSSLPAVTSVATYLVGALRALAREERLGRRPR